jgi:hypothetical protein
MNEKMSEKAVEIRGGFINELRKSGMSDAEIEKSMNENLQMVNILCQVFADLEEKKNG